MRLDELLSLLPLGFFRGFVLLFGLLWGSFLNVVIYRVPREMSVVTPGSHCPGCGKPIAGYDNVPVLSYVLLLGKSRCCKTRMSPRYPLVELLGGLLSLAVFEAVILALPGATPVGRALAVYGADFALCLGLLSAAFIDAEHMFLPDSITIGGAVLGVVMASSRDLGLRPSLVGALVGFLVIWFPFIFLYKGLLGRTGMGMGDAKLLALAGAWFGWPGALFTLLAGALQGTIYAGIAKALGIEQTLPAAVLADIAELEAAAANGDEEAKRALAEDPLTEDEDDAFIVDFFRRLLGTKKDGPTDAEAPADGPAPDAPDAGGSGDAAKPAADEAPPGTAPDTAIEVETGDDERHRLRIPFGPFLILAILELLFAGDWLREHFFNWIWPGL